MGRRCLSGADGRTHPPGAVIYVKRSPLANEFRHWSSLPAKFSIPLQFASRSYLGCYDPAFPGARHDRGPVVALFFIGLVLVGRALEVRQLSAS